jgi:hypothetical protein
MLRAGKRPPVVHRKRPSVRRAPHKIENMSQNRRSSRNQAKKAHMTHPLDIAAFNQVRRDVGVKNLRRDNSHGSSIVVANRSEFRDLSATRKRRADIRGIDDGQGSMLWKRDHRAAKRRRTQVARPPSPEY